MSRGYTTLSDQQRSEVYNTGLPALASQTARLPAPQPIIPGAGGQFTISIPKGSLDGLVVCPAVRFTLRLVYTHEKGVPFSVPLKAHPEIGYYGLFDEIRMRWGNTVVHSFTQAQLIQHIYKLSIIMSPLDFSRFQQEIGCSVAHSSEFLQGPDAKLDVGEFRGFSQVVVSPTADPNVEQWAYDINLSLPILVPFLGLTPDSTCFDPRVIDADVSVDFTLSALNPFRHHLEVFSSVVETGMPHCDPPVRMNTSVDDSVLIDTGATGVCMLGLRDTTASTTELTRPVAVSEYVAPIVAAFRAAMSPSVPLLVGMHPAGAYELVSTAYLGHQVEALRLGVRLRSIAGNKPTVMSVPQVDFVRFPDQAPKDMTKVWGYADTLDPLDDPIRSALPMTNSTEIGMITHLQRCQPNFHELGNAPLFAMQLIAPGFPLDIDSLNTYTDAITTAAILGNASQLNDVKHGIPRSEHLLVGVKGSDATGAGVGTLPQINHTLGAFTSNNSYVLPSVYMAHVKVPKAMWLPPDQCPLVKVDGESSRAVVMRDVYFYQSENIGYACRLGRMNRGETGVWPIGGRSIKFAADKAPVPYNTASETIATEFIVFQSPSSFPTLDPNECGHPGLSYGNLQPQNSQSSWIEQMRGRACLTFQQDPRMTVVDIDGDNNITSLQGLGSFFNPYTTLGNTTALTRNNPSSSVQQSPFLYMSAAQSTDQPPSAMPGIYGACAQYLDCGVTNIWDLLIPGQSWLWTGIVGGGFQILQSARQLTPTVFAATTGDATGPQTNQATVFNPVAYATVSVADSGTPPNTGIYPPGLLYVSAAADGFPRYLQTGSFSRMPGLQSAVGVEVLEQATCMDSIVAGVQTLPSGCMYVSHTLLNTCIIYTLLPPSKEARDAIKSRSEEYIEFTHIFPEIMLFNLGTTPPATNDVTGLNPFNLTFPITGQRVHGIEFAIITTSTQYPYPRFVLTLPFKSLNVMVSGIQGMLIDPGTFPTPLRPYKTFCLSEPEPATTPNEARLYPPWIFPKSLPRNAQLDDHRNMLYAQMFPTAANYAWSRAQTHPLSFTCYSFADGGHTELANCNVTLSGEFATKLASGTVRPLPCITSAGFQYAQDEAPGPQPPNSDPTTWVGGFVLSGMQDYLSLGTPIMGTPNFEPSVFMAEMGPPSGLYRIVPPSTNIQMLVIVNQTVVSRWFPASQAFTVFK